MKTAVVLKMVSGVGGLALMCAPLAGCGVLSSPTYGTGKTAMRQLADDVIAVASIGSGSGRSAVIQNRPRPDLVMPPASASTTLIAPQQSLAGKDNPNWLESPEQTRARLIAEAGAHADDPNYRSPLLAGRSSKDDMTEAQKQELFRKARAIQNDAYPETRRFLSDLPASYRQIDPDALTDLGEPEKKKEKEREKAARLAG